MRLSVVIPVRNDAAMLATALESLGAQHRPPDEIVVSSTSAAPAEEKPKKAGWWQRGFFGN